MPKTNVVLGRFLVHLGDKSGPAAVSEACKKTRTEIKSVWHHHFASRLIEGKELGCEKEQDEKRRLFKQIITLTK